jgi:hypothetical protein
LISKYDPKPTTAVSAMENDVLTRNCLALRPSIDLISFAFNPISTSRRMDSERPGLSSCLAAHAADHTKDEPAFGWRRMPEDPN